MHGWEIADRRQLLKASLFALGTDLFALAAAAADDPPAEAPSVIGRALMLKGLDGMSRVADPGHDPFADGHNAAAVLSAPFYCKEQRLDSGVQQALLTVMEKRLLTNRIYTARPEEK